MASDNRIVDHAPYGRHIALRCKNHPHLRWSTKNIDYIGARTIFYSLMQGDPKEPECSCPASDLEPVPAENAPRVEP